jgi:holo-[acyl-carrier protein] synthase
VILGIGIEVVEVMRMAGRLERESFLRKVFTPAEIDACRAVHRIKECFAGKFAVKEAFMKALGAGISQGVWFTNFEVLNDETGAPYAELSSKATEILEARRPSSVYISVTRGAGVAVGLVILDQ